MAIKFFNKTEVKTLLWIFGFLILISIPNFRLSIKRAHDAQRRDALGKITTFLSEFKNTNSGYPLSDSDGKMIGCDPKTIDKVAVYSVCKWEFEFAEEFRYISNGNYYQILGFLEVTEAGSEYDPQVVARNIKCGDKICNTGRASFRTPLDISIDEYQNKIDEQNKK